MEKLTTRAVVHEVTPTAPKSQGLLHKSKSAPKLSFVKKAFDHLSPHDQTLFEQFGQGPLKDVPFSCIHYAFEAQARDFPEAIAVSHQGESINYETLNSQANQLASILTEAGVSTGDHVGLFVQRSIPMIVGILGILKAGAAYVPQHIGVAPESQLSHVAHKAELKVILTLAQFKDLVPVAEGQTCLVLEDLIASMSNEVLPDFIPPRLPSRDTTAFIIFTSGTTGPPNGVQVTHKNVGNILLTAPGNLGIVPGTKVGQILSIAFDMAVWEILGCLANGGTLMIRGKNIEETVRQVDVVISTPTILSGVNVKKCKNVKVVAVAGEPCPRTLADTWGKFCQFYNSCGPTETTIINTAQLYSAHDEILSIGKPTPNNTVYVLDENKRACAIGETGEMWAGGDCVSAGYLSNPQLNSERYAPDPFLGGDAVMFRTRDLGRWTKDGTLEHLGRTDDQVKIKGFRVELDSVSAVLEAVPDCKRAVALKYDNKNLVAFVSPAHINEATAKEAVAGALPYYCVPSHVIALPELPKTTRGKIDKRLLMKLAKEQIEGSKQDNIYQDYTTVALPPQKPWFRRMWDTPKLMHYNRLFFLVLLANLGVLAHALGSGGWWSGSSIALQSIAHTVLVNFALAIFMRQQYVINALFGLATGVPKTAPLSIRRRMGKIYHFGGIHVGGSIAGTLWLAAFAGSLAVQQWRNPAQVPLGLAITTYALLALLVGIVILALPHNRAKRHNTFEISHRLGGWAALLLFWIQAFVFIDAQAGNTPYFTAVSQSLSFWMLLIITISIALPWIRLQKVPVEIASPSRHVALVKFNYGVTPFAGSSTAISRNPLLEWHSFANVPSPHEDGFRLTISRAGDWTGQFIDDLPSHVWVKGIPTAGVGNIDKLFSKVIWLATGSGIGPCLPHMLSKETPSQLVWATRNPRKTYGDALVDEILEVQPNAIIWDTDQHGKPDMVKLAYKAYQDFGAEAVICISNKKLTWQVVSGLESRNIPAYGAIWDS
jgi:amino acid adenylation domain-containing protein